MIMMARGSIVVVRDLLVDCRGGEREQVETTVPTLLLRTAQRLLEALSPVASIIQQAHRTHVEISSDLGRSVEIEEKIFASTGLD